jgi:hypothetical protein
MLNYKVPERPPKPMLYKVAIRVYNHELFRRVIPIEAALSFPVPGDLNGIPVVFFFHYWEKNIPEHSVSRPLTRIATRVGITAENVEIYQYAIATQDQPLFPGIEDPSSDLREDLPINARNKLEEALYISCEQLLNNYPDVSETLAHTYLSALRHLALPGLMPFYRALNLTLINE